MVTSSSQVAVRPTRQAGRQIATPSLVLLLGSTAGEVGREYITHLSTLDLGDQQRVACIFIDTDGLPRESRSGVHTFHLRIAVPAGIDSVPRAEHDQHTFIEGRIPRYYANGAGGVRNNAHAALAFNEREVVDACEQALLAICQLDESCGGVGEVQVNLVAFLGGGTGSGILADMALLIREQLVQRGLSHRLNLVCLLPESVYGSTTNDLVWRKSNATACLLEVIALGRAAAASGEGIYRKYLRQNCHAVPGVPLAHEVFLTGDLHLNDAGETARVVGLDLFMRTTDGSGVGAEEHRRWVDRRALGGTDDRGLPTIFGTSWPYEVRFPVQEAARAFALRSVKRMIAYLQANPLPQEQPTSEEERRLWRNRWMRYARFDHSQDPFAIAVPTFGREQFEQAEIFHLDGLWRSLEQAKVGVEARLRAVCDLVLSAELARIAGREGYVEVEAARGQRFAHVQRLRSLKREFEAVYQEMAALPPMEVPGRPRDLESELIAQNRQPMFLRLFSGGKAEQVCSAYNACLQAWARQARRRALLQALQYLCSVVQGELERGEVWLRLAGSQETQQELTLLHEPGNTWMGKLEKPHRHQRHLFDLPSLQSASGGNSAINALYAWVSGGSDEQRFAGQIALCLSQLSSLQSSPEVAGTGEQGEVKLTPRRCLRAMQAFFEREYLYLLQQLNLIELLDRATPPTPQGMDRGEYLESFLTAHLSLLHGQMRSPLTFEPQIWDGGLAVLETSIYLGIHWRDAAQGQLVSAALQGVENLPYRGQAALLSRSADPHRMQVLVGQHALSLSTVGEFCREGRGAMDAYLTFQRQWEVSGGMGLMPVHSCGETQRLVREPQALGLGKPLPACVMRPLR